MNDRELESAYQEAQGRVRRTAACLDADALDQLARREGPEAERAARLDHVMACPGCQREFELLRSIRRAARMDEGGTAVPLVRRSWWAIAAVLVAAIGLSTLLPRLRSGPDLGGGPDRGGDGQRVILLAPKGPVAAAGPVRFVWRPVGDALEYRVEVARNGDQVVASGTTADTSWVLPDSARLEAGIGLRWWVAALRRDGTRVEAVPAEFRVEPGR